MGFYNRLALQYFISIAMHNAALKDQITENLIPNVNCQLHP